MIRRRTRLFACRIWAAGRPSLPHTPIDLVHPLVDFGDPAIDLVLPLRKLCPFAVEILLFSQFPSSSIVPRHL
jgi:hypothetical protein